MPERVPAVLVSKDTGFRYYGNVWADKVCGWTREVTATRIMSQPLIPSDYVTIASLERDYDIIQLTRIE